MFQHFIKICKWTVSDRCPGSSLTCSVTGANSVEGCCSHEYTMSYVYHQMSSYFNRDNVSLPGLASLFRANSLEERSHAQALMDFQVPLPLPSHVSLCWLCLFLYLSLLCCIGLVSRLLGVNARHTPACSLIYQDMEAAFALCFKCGFCTNCDC